MLNFSNTPLEYRPVWDYRDMIHQLDLGGGGEAWYQYDGSKQRTRKVVRRENNEYWERIYLGGYELYRRYVNNQLQEETETHHLFADDQRILIVEDKLVENASFIIHHSSLQRYQYGNHLGSVALECDAAGDLISYEEYHPYGTTAYQAHNASLTAIAKRYRYTGMERDEESGLAYHGARYYSPWLGRWGSCDPIGVEG
ncbi:MAG: RHS repeat-associated core domain-containing protein, partial [Lewinellaceae bacterium]|nr:RHS repeat-associated core domain-containing protein [Lewinellaceae bacterium]